MYIFMSFSWIYITSQAVFNLHVSDLYLKIFLDKTYERFLLQNGEANSLI